MAQKIEFTKMHGAGNDYIYVDTMRFPIDNPERLSVRLSAYHTGIGSDGLILIGSSKIGDFSMRIFNNDGSEAMMCGNGTRCVGKYLYDSGITDKNIIRLETKSGIKVLHLFIDKKGKVESVRVDMGEPILSNKSQLATVSGAMTDGEIKVGERTYTGTYVCMGNPHFVIFVDNINTIDLTLEGKSLEHSAIFPERCNIEFAEVRPEGKIRTRVWERGSGITMACGTGACATAVAAKLTGRAENSSTIIMDGGNLNIEWSEQDNHIYMTGPATTVFKGEIEI